MHVELRNVSHRNKGAELMLRTLVDRLQRHEGVRLVANSRVGTPQELAKLGIQPLQYAHVSDRRYISPPRFARGVFGGVHPSDLDFVLDGAGFAYGDQWGPKKALHAFDYYEAVKRAGAKVVLLPQSFGPFDDAAVRSAVRKLIGVADLVFPRDDTAAKHVRALMDDSHIVQAPDFTPLLHPDLSEVADVELGSRPAALIPNRKMIQKTAITEERYSAFVALVAELMRERGYAPFLLPHAVYDHELAARIADQVSGDVPTIIEHDAVRLKALIGRCDVVMCSRFHGLVSALSQAVPVIATGWSHKYQHLLAEYESADSLVQPESSDDALCAQINELLTDEALAARRETLRRRAAWHEDASEKMWHQVEVLMGLAA